MLNTRVGDEDADIYEVVVNHEDQFSIWPEDREIPDGWKRAGKAGTKEDCLQYIKGVWTDMRPLSLRVKMDGLGGQSTVPSSEK